MEAFLRSVQSRLLTEDVAESPVHAVLGGPQPDVDTVATTLCLALHLNQKEPSDGLCLPVLWLWRRDAPLPEETLRFLQRVRISESLLLWRDHVDLLGLQRSGKLCLTLLREGLLDSSECQALKSSVLRVVHHRGGQRDAEDDGTSSAVKTVAGEILQEAAERVGAALGETLGEALRMQREALWQKHGCRSEQLDELMSYLEQVSHRGQTKLQDWEQLLTKDAKEFSDGEMTVVLTSVTTDKEERHVLAERLKSFCHRHGYDSVVVLLSITDPLCHSRQQVAVYASNTDILNQLCCELEETSSWSLSGELDAKENFQVYHIPVNTIFPGTPPVLEEEIQGLLKDFVDRRSSVLACHPSSRTSSTEGVAGSIDFSQGSSGITDMDGGDMERGDAGSGDGATGARALADGEEDTGAGGAVELVSPDSGMTTIRSSRSSKESSVFLSDDSPLGEVLAGGGPSGPGQFLRNPSPLGLLSLSPPVPPERRRNRSNRNKIDNVDLFSFDPLHSGTANPEGDVAGRPSSSEMEELSLVDFSAPTSMSGFNSRNSSIDFHIQTVVPPTPVNSLVGSRPPSSCGVRFFPEDVVERINGLQHKDSVSSSLSENWDEFSFDTQGAMSSSDNSSWNVAKACESPQNVLEVIKSNESNAEAKEDVSKSDSSKAKGLEPQLSLIIEQTESHDSWNPDRVINDKWNPVSLADLQLTPPEEEAVVKRKTGIIIGAKDKKSKKKELLNTLTPDTSKEDDEDGGKKGGKHQTELLDFWTYSAQKGFLKSDSGTTTSYPESLDMWNMTIRDDSLSPLNTPDCLSENSGSFCGASGNVSVESPQGVDKGMAMWNTTIREDSASTIASPEGSGKDLSGVGSLQASPETPEGKNVAAEMITEEVRSDEPNVKIVIEAAEQENGQETWDVDQTESAQDDANQISDPWELPVPGMVTSTSEYDNVGGGGWSLSSSPDTSLVVDLIQLEAQSSPFIGVTQTKSEEEETEHSEEVLKQELSSDQVFTFEGLKESDNIRKVRKDGEASQEQPDDHSPFMLVEVNQRAQLEQSVSANLFNWDDLISKTQQATVKSAKEEINQGLAIESESEMSKTVSSGSVGERGDGLKYSPDSLHPGSRDELRSSDGDSSSGLEMESIIVSGMVKEAERERPVPKETKKSMETFSMLSYAATILQAQTAHKHKETGLDQSQSTPTPSMIPKIISPSQLEALQKSDGKQEDDKSTVPPRSTSPSLRYPSDHFLKTREEVYVHSQISMEDSDEGGLSPSTMPPTSLGDIQAWSEQLERQDTQGTYEAHTPGTSEVQSPVATSNSSASHSSSYTESPLSETAPPPPPEKGLGLPFSGDLMEEENEEEEVEEETKEQAALPTPQDRYDSEQLAEQAMGHTQLLRHQDVTSQPPFQPMRGDSAYEWAGSESVPQVQTQYGYNYHHIDQRTEHHGGLLTCVSPKAGSQQQQQQTGEVYAEFTSVSSTDGYYEPRGSAAYGSEDYLVQSAYESDPSRYRHAEAQGQYESEHAQYGSDGQQLYSSDAHTARGDHARYVQDGYVHFLLSRQSQQQERDGDADTGSRDDPEDMDNREDPPSSADVSAGSGQRRKLAAPPLNVSLEHSEGSLLSEDALDSEEETGDELDLNMDEMDTPDEADSVDFDAQGESCEAAAAASGPSTHSEQSRETKLWRSVVIGEQEHRIDMKCIEPYKRVISHGGYYEEQHAIIVFAACFLPDSDCDNYNYVMENLFLYVISTLELMVAEDYMIVYLNGATPRRRMPGFTWMKKCYQMIDRRLKKNLKMFIIVHPSWFIRTLLGITRPFISSKFSSKIKYVHSLQELGQIIPMEYVHIPPSIIRLDSELQETTCKSDRKRSSAV